MACPAEAEPAAAQVEASVIHPGQPAKEPARAEGPQQQGPAKRLKKGKGRSTGGQQSVGEPVLVPPGSSAAAGLVTRLGPPAKRRQEALQQPVLGALPSEQQLQMQQQQQQGPVDHQGQQEGYEVEQLVGHGAEGEPAAKKPKLPTTSQVGTAALVFPGYCVQTTNPRAASSAREESAGRGSHTE